MSFLDGIEVPSRRIDRNNCKRCEATAAGCRSREWLSGQLCCGQCPGNHDEGDNA